MAYPRNAASPERIAIGAVVQISDGAVQSAGVTITVRGQGGAEAAGGGTTAYGATGVIVYYTPTQPETDFTSFVVIASKTGCIPVAQTIVTSASATAGYSGVDWAMVANPTSTVGLTNTTVGITTLVTTTTTLTNLPAITANWLTAAGIAAGALNGKGDWPVGKTGYSLTAVTGLGNQTADITGSLSGSVGSVTGAVGSVTGNVGGNVVGSVASVTAGVTLANGAHGGAAATMQLGGAGGLTSTLTGNLTGSVGSVTGAVGSVTGAVGSVTGAVGSVTGLTAADVGAIKAKTDSLTFTTAGMVDSAIKRVGSNTLSLAGTGGQGYGG